MPQYKIGPIKEKDEKFSVVVFLDSQEKERIVFEFSQVSIQDILGISDTENPTEEEIKEKLHNLIKNDNHLLIEFVKRAKSNEEVKKQILDTGIGDYCITYKEYTEILKKQKEERRKKILAEWSDQEACP